MDKKRYTKIPNRGQIITSGEKSKDFLQGIITNDINLLNRQDLIYSCLLTPQGKFLHDFFIRKENEKYIIECEGGNRTIDLYERLKKYRLRTPIEINYNEQIDVYQIWGENGNDPRLPELGTRTYKQPQNIKKATYEEFNKHRLSLAVPNGSEDIEIGKYHPQECNLDKFNAISFTKGCYIGQELVSRIKHRGLLKKRLYLHNDRFTMLKIKDEKN